MTWVGVIASTLVAATLSASVERTPQQLELESRLERSAREANTAESWNQLAHFRFRIADYPGTLTALESAERIDPQQPYPELLRGAIAEMRLEYADALKHYRESNARDPSHEFANTQLQGLEGWLDTLERVTDARERVGQRLVIALVGWGALVLSLLAALRKIDRRVVSP